jgi:hypothetical protein
MMASCSVHTAVTGEMECADPDEKGRILYPGQCKIGQCTYTICCNFFKTNPDFLTDDEFEGFVLHEMIHCCSTLKDGIIVGCVKQCYAGYTSGYKEKPCDVDCLPESWLLCAYT